MGKRFDNEIAGKHLKILGTLKSPVNVREIPINGRVTGSASPGATVGIATGNLFDDQEGYTWIQIINNNIKAWVRGDLISQKTVVTVQTEQKSFLPILLVVGAGWFLFFKKKR